VEKGEICQQEPIANRVLSSQKTNIAVIVQQDDPWHGHYKGDPTDPQNQWHRMPKVIGMTVEDAKAAIKKAGFTIEKLTEVVSTQDPACRIGLVCRQYPEALHSNRETAKRSLIVGEEIPAPTPPASPTEKQDKPAERPTGAGDKKKGDFDY
jgi:beta-lactam-binding protein with PASTA domain